MDKYRTISPKSILMIGDGVPEICTLGKFLELNDELPAEFFREMINDLLHCGEATVPLGNGETTPVRIAKHIP